VTRKGLEQRCFPSSSRHFSTAKSRMEPEATSLLSGVVRRDREGGGGVNVPLLVRGLGFCMQPVMARPAVKMA